MINPQVIHFSGLNIISLGVNDTLFNQFMSFLTFMRVFFCLINPLMSAEFSFSACIKPVSQGRITKALLLCN